MSEPIFREKSLQKVKSPDNLDEYIRIASPGVWLIMITIIFLLLGFCVWSVFGTVNTVVSADVHCEDGSAVCYVAEKDMQKVQLGMTVEFGDYTGTIAEITLRDGNIGACSLDTEAAVPDGIYSASILVESIHPSAFLTN